MFHKKLCYYYGAYHQTDQKNKDFSLDRGMLRRLELIKQKNIETPN
jgi:hypothetical protein